VPDANRQLPRGTVTFLFTDIEGSTRLVSRLASGYAGVLAIHAGIIRAALAAHEGVEVSTEGDAFFAVFPSAIDAVRAVAVAQRELAAAGWPEGVDLRVRMGLHTGEARLGGDNYAGLDVNRAARIAAAGHGGQVLLSDATRALVEHDLPDGVALRDLAEHRLKDLPAPERIWQLEIAGLQVDFPAIRSLDARPNNLPTPPTDLVGREGDLATLSQLLGGRRLVTLVGPGGTGKTRLAIALAARLLPTFPDGAFFASLEDARERPEVVRALGVALAVRETPDRDLEASVKRHLSDRDLLLVLDNFEQVLDAAPLVAELLAGSPKLRIVVTSRSPLHVSGEQEFDVGPLPVPATAAASVEELSALESVALFVRRAQAVRAGFSLTPGNAAAVAEICVRLDGLPLAIELAAASSRLLTPDAILDRLRRRLPLIAAGARDAPARQQTLRDTIHWSYELLEPSDRRLFDRAAVFAGGWTIDACEVVCNPAAELGIDTLMALASLADMSLIRPAAPDDIDPRFEMLGLIREFATERLDSGPDPGSIRRRHAIHIRDLVERAEPELTRRDLRRWQRVVRREEDNVRAALGWAIEAGEAEIGLRTAAALWRFWHYWAELREGRDWLERLLALPGAQAASLARSRAENALAGILYWQGHAAEAARLYGNVLEFARATGDDGQIGRALVDVAWGLVAQGNVEGALVNMREASAAFRRAGDATREAAVNQFIAQSGFMLNAGGRAEDALRAAETTLQLVRADGDLFGEADLTGGLALIRFRAGDPEGAHRQFLDAIRLWREMENVGMLPYLKLGAVIELQLGRPERAARLAAAAARAVEDLGGELPAEMIGVADPLLAVRQQLDPDVFAREVRLGRAMSFAESLDFALHEEGVPGR